MAWRSVDRMIPARCDAVVEGAMISITRRYTAVTEATELAVPLHAVHAYNGHIAAVAALKLTSLVFMHPGGLRAAERR